MSRLSAALVCLLLSAGSLGSAEEASIRVHAREEIGRASRYFTGACLEDVNHEVYGGLYSQMVFGESFQEPPPPPAIRGFRADPASWQIEDGVLSVRREPGPKLILEGAEVERGAIGVDVFLPGQASGVAGVIVAVRDARPGIDTFTGYEISLASDRQALVLGRHRQNWEPIREVPCEVPTDHWISLSVRFGPGELEAAADGKTIVSYRDEEHPLKGGSVGLRPFQRDCRYRRFWIETGGEREEIPFEVEPRWDDGVSRMWRAYRRGKAEGRFSVELVQPFAGRQSQRLEHRGGEGEIGIENRGLNRQGMCFVAGEAYEGCIWARAEAPARLRIALESQDGSVVLAETRVEVSSRTWVRRDFALAPERSEDRGRLAIGLEAPGAVGLGYVFLQPGANARFRGLPVRRDVVEALIEQGITVLRYGGSMVNHPEYRWKKMIGPRDRRPPTAGTWYPWSTNGWGIIDFLDLCEAAGFLAIPAFNMGETPEDMGDFVEYVNGPQDTPWGMRRVAHGRPQPYRLKHIELGNEERVDEDYYRRFAPMAKAIWAKDRDIVIVVGDFAYSRPFADASRVEGAASGISNLEAHRKILELAKAHGREVWFDVHVWNHEPRDPDGLGGLPSFLRALGTLCPGANYKVAVFELNAVNHALRRALSYAHAIGELERLGEVVPVVCSANCLQVDGQNDNGWDQGLLFMDPCKVWPQPPWHVTRMLARTWLPLVVRAESSSPRNALDVTAKRNEDGSIVQLQVVNVEGEPITARIRFEGFSPGAPAARATTLSGPLDAVNTAAEPDRVRPTESERRLEFADGSALYTFPPHSFTILRFE